MQSNGQTTSQEKPGQDANMTDNYVSYQSPSTIIAETVYHFLRGSLYGAAFGLVRWGD